MIKSDENSNAQTWELEISCKNKKYLDAVVEAILKYGILNFEVEVGECIGNHPEWDSRYTVLIWCSWFNNLASIANDLAEIQEKLEKR